MQAKAAVKLARAVIYVAFSALPNGAGLRIGRLTVSSGRQRRTLPCSVYDFL